MPSRKKSTGWKNIDWDEGGPPEDNVTLARCPGLLQRFWLEYMENSDILWETPSAIVDEGGGLTRQPEAPSYSGEIRRRSDMSQHDLYTVRRRINLDVLTKRIKEHFWILKSSVKINANKLINTSSERHEGVYNFEFRTLDGFKYNAGLTRIKDREVRGDQGVHIWIKHSTRLPIEVRQKAISMLCNLGGYYCISPGTGLMAPSSSDGSQSQVLEEMRQPAAPLLSIQSTPATATASVARKTLVLHKPAPLGPIQEEPWEDRSEVSMMPNAARESFLRSEPAPPTPPPTRKCPQVPASYYHKESIGDASSSVSQPQVPEEWRQPAAPLVPIQSTLAPATASVASESPGSAPSVTDVIDIFF
jgi:hypothetical protein